jgi:hypothetical protein
MLASIRNELNRINASHDAEFRLSRLLERMHSGSDAVYVSPITKGISPEDILSGWDKIYNANSSQLNDILLELEESNRSKYGPRSIALPWLEREQESASSFSIDTGKLIETATPVYGRLRPISLASAATYIKKQTNAGLPSMETKRLVLDDTLLRFEELNKLDIPSVPFTRTQENFKTRLVWGYPLVTILDEMRYYRPILEYQSKVPWRAALRKASDIDLAITQLINHAQVNGLSLLSIDFSSFDNSVKRKLQTYAFNDYFPSLFQSKYRPEIVSQGRRFNEIGLITPSGLWKGQHGIPSGSAYTNEVGSVVQYGISNTYKDKLLYSQVQGDDGAYATSDPDGLKDHFRSYGLEVNDKKSYISDDFIVYLQNLYHRDYIKDGLISGIYPTYRALLRIVYQERFNDFSEDSITGKDYYSIRTLSILENCKHHPLFKQLVQYVSSLDKYNLEVSDQGISAYVKMREKQDGKDVRFTEYRLGDSYGIKSFESYKIAREIQT